MIFNFNFIYKKIETNFIDNIIYVAIIIMFHVNYCIEKQMLLDIANNILDDIEYGICIKDIRENLPSYIYSVSHKEIIINRSHIGVRLNRDIINEMAKKGDLNAIEILNYSHY